MDDRDQLDIREQIGRIDRNQAELQKLLAEGRKYNEADFQKLRKYNRDPWFLVIGAIIAAISARLPEILHAFGHG